MNDKIKINLQIADSNYPLTINRQEEEMVREAAKQVNIRLNAYREYYKNLEPEKIIAMVAYQFSLEKLQLMQRNDTSPYVEKVKELTELLEDYLKRNKNDRPFADKRETTTHCTISKQSPAWIFGGAFLFIYLN